MTSTSRVYQVISIAAIPIVVIAIALMVDNLLHPFETDFSTNSPFWVRWVYGGLFSVGSMVIGLLCIRRVKGNLMGPLLVIYGAGLAWQSIYSSFDPEWGMLIINFSGYLVWVGFYVLMMLYPNGRPYPAQMRWILFLALATMVFLPIFATVGVRQFTLGPDIAPIRSIDNSFFDPRFEVPYQLLQSFAVGILTPIIFIALPVSVFLRYRAGNAQERAQLRWILFGTLLTGIVAIAQLAATQLGFSTISILMSNAGAAIVFTLPALAVGNAILRHKLYDIDIIIRRTLIYTVLTTILGVVYFGGIVLTQQVFRALTGQSSELAIVASTLLIAALFAPLRRRVQDVIDRRLYRKKYDAEKVLADFQKNLRDEVDMETLKANLIGVLDDTMQPTKIALWVKEPKS